MHKILPNLSTFKNGWLVGEFLPSIIKTKDIEVGIKEYKAGTVEPNHVHYIISEYTIVLSGTINMSGVEYNKGDIILIEPGTPNQFISLTDSMLLVIKSPSCTNDKHIL